MPTQPPIQWVSGAISPGLKRQGREADHSPPPSAEVKNVEQYLHNKIRLHDVVLKRIKHRENFTFNEPSGSIKWGIFLGQRRKYQIFKQDSATRS
jgi:hypothetical protein